MKTCRDCKQTKEIQEFIKNKAFKSGVDTLCLLCNRQRVYKWRQKGKRKSAIEAKKYYDKYPEKGKTKAAKYRASKLKACPSWINLQEIEQIYKNCPAGYHVDHIIPLQGQTVSGLHVPWNLQYLPAKENISKGNKFHG